MKTIARQALLAALSFYLLPDSSSAQILPPFLTGFVELSAVQAEVDGVRRETLTQDYNLSFTQSIAGNMQLRAAARYSKFDLESPELTGALREEIQPSADLFWKHPHFVFSSSAYRRELRLISSDGSVITDQLQLNLRSNDPELPIAELRYGWQQITDEGSTAARDSRDRQLQASIAEEFDWQDLRYTFNHRVSENQISGLEVTQNSHHFRWGAARTPLDTDRLSLAANYAFSYRDELDEVSQGEGVLEGLSILSGLYNRDASPEFGELDRLAELSDQVFDRGTDPAIDIGGANQDQNVGVDLGFERVSSTIYVYVDRLSGAELAWSVYSSEDNLSWDPTTPLSQRFNSGLRRYEIRYAELSRRYVKVVSSGLNTIPLALVSEIEIFGPVPERPSNRRINNAHVADLMANYAVSDRWDTSLDLSYRHQPAQGNEGQRRNLDYALRAGFEQSELLSHSFRWEEAFQRFDARRPRIRDDVLSYSLFVDPLPTISISSSANGRFETIGSERTRETYSLLTEGRGDLSRNLTLLSSLGANRAFLYNRGSRSDTWTYRLGTRGSVTRSLTAELGWSHQQTTSQPMDRLRVRSTITAGFNLRLTRTIFFRGSFNQINDMGDNTSQDYLLSWRLAPNLSFSAQTLVTDFGEDQRTRQYSVNLNYDISMGSALFFRYTSVDYSDAGGALTDSFQQGFRTAL